MSWTKILTINIVVLLLFIIFLEVVAGLSRVVVGKQYYFPSFFVADPCVEMRTDVLLSHVHHNPSLCQIKNGYGDDEYVRYNMSNVENPVLLLLGGSTTDGFYQHISAGDTYPNYLAQLLADDYMILNGGVGGYSSLQELYKVIRDAPRISNLHTAVSLNGINETPDYQGSNEIRMFEFPFLTSLQANMNTQQTWIDQRLLAGKHRILPNLYSLVLFLGKKKEPVDIRVNTTLRDPKIIEAADRWLSNITRIHDVLRGQGVRYYVFLQPTMGLEGVQSSPEKDSADEVLFGLVQDPYIQEIRSTYAKLSRYCSELSYCFDISDAVPPAGNMYNDPRHHNSNGNQLLAQTIADIIRLQDTLVSQ
jgi:hypothetical protein